MIIKIAGSHYSKDFSLPKVGVQLSVDDDIRADNFKTNNIKDYYFIACCSTIITIFMLKLLQQSFRWMFCKKIPSVLHVIFTFFTIKTFN